MKSSAESHISNPCSIETLVAPPQDVVDFQRTFERKVNKRREVQIFITVEDEESNGMTAKGGKQTEEVTIVEECGTGSKTNGGPSASADLSGEKRSLEKVTIVEVRATRNKTDDDVKSKKKREIIDIDTLKWTRKKVKGNSKECKLGEIISFNFEKFDNVNIHDPVELFYTFTDFHLVLKYCNRIKQCYGNENLCFEIVT